MPLVKIHIHEGWSCDDIDRLLDTTHAVMVEAFGVPERDRYQILSEHRPGSLRVLDTGLDLPRSDRFVLVEMVSRPRGRERKLLFYRLLSERLFDAVGVPPADLMVSFIINGDEDWSFGNGRAQFLTGELSG